MLILWTPDGPSTRLSERFLEIESIIFLNWIDGGFLKKKAQN